MSITPFSTAAVPTTGDLMHTDLVTVSPDSTLFVAAGLMARHHVSGLPVIDEAGRAVGVITLADLAARWLHREREPDQEMSFYRNLCGQSEDMAAYFASFYSADATLKVGDLMTPRVLHVSEHMLVTDLIRLLLEHGVHRAFVSRSHRLIGVVTTTDVMRGMLKVLG